MARIPKGAPGSKQPQSGSVETEKGVGKGKPVILKLEQGLDKSYLCAHICAAEKSPKLMKNGNRDLQKTVELAIRTESIANEHVWGYLPEVGYNMRYNPPRPLMSSNPNRKHLPSSFPLGASRSEIQNYTKGDLRIPDIVILTITPSEMIAMRQKRIIDWSKFYPFDDNIKTIVEVKFNNDDWNRDQYKAYNKIAGGRVRELRNGDCSCDTRKPSQQTQQSPVFLPILNPTPYAEEKLIPLLNQISPQNSLLDKLLKTSPQIQIIQKPTAWEDFQQVAVPVAIGTAITAGVIFGEIVTAGVGGFAVVGFVALANS
jgi:hypothetical protein